MTPITTEISGGEAAIIGARFLPSGGALPAGRYSATITARDAASGQTMVMNWPFEAIESTQRIYLPVLRR
jgi:hypothetical protein